MYLIIHYLKSCFEIRRNNNRKRLPDSFHKKHEWKRRKTRDEVYSMKNKLTYGSHYQLDPQAVGFSGVHVEKSIAKIFTPPTYQDIRSALRNLRHHKDEQPFTSQINSLSRWCVSVGCEKAYVSRKDIVKKCNNKQVLQSNTVHFSLIVERMFTVIFEITNDVPLRRFRQAGRWNQWLGNLSSVDKENLSKYHYKF